MGQALWFFADNSVLISWRSLGCPAESREEAWLPACRLYRIWLIWSMCRCTVLACCFIVLSPSSQLRYSITWSGKKLVTSSLWSSQLFSSSAAWSFSPTRESAAVEGSGKAASWETGQFSWVLSLLLQPLLFSPWAYVTALCTGYSATWLLHLPWGKLGWSGVRRVVLNSWSTLQRRSTWPMALPCLFLVGSWDLAHVLYIRRRWLTWNFLCD